jgi:hypothetical protein
VTIDAEIVGVSLASGAKVIASSSFGNVKKIGYARD